MVKLTAYQHELREAREQPLSWYIAWSLPRVHIAIRPDQFTWRRRSKEVVLPTHVYLNHGRTRVLSVGDVPKGEPYVEVPLFERPAAHADVREAVLEAYFKEGFIRLFDRRFMLKPYVQFSNVELLSEPLLGYQKIVLSYAALRAGAASVSFAQPQPPRSN